MSHLFQPLLGGWLDLVTSQLDKTTRPVLRPMAICRVQPCRTPPELGSLKDGAPVGDTFDSASILGPMERPWRGFTRL